LPTAQPNTTRDIGYRPGVTPASIGPYHVERVLGAGGWSTVFAVRDADGAPWALKRLRADLGPEAMARFHREVDSLRRVDHPGVVHLHDAGIAAGAPYLVTPLLEGPTLRTALADGPLVPEVALAIVLEAACAVAAIHAAGLVHRDLKPDNLVLDRAGTVIVIDLGLALGPEHSRHTATDALTGSVPYMAPEQIEDRLPSAASDVWALAVVLFEAIVGRRPFQRARGSEEVAAILAGRAPDLAEQAPAASDELAAVVARCLDPVATRRVPDAAALVGELTRLVDPRAPVDLARWCAAPAEVAAEVASRRAGRAGGGGDRGPTPPAIASPRPGTSSVAWHIAPRIRRSWRWSSAYWGARGQARTIRGAAPAPSSSSVTRRAAPSVERPAPSVSRPPPPVVTPRRRRPWWIAAALAIALAIGILVARPWSRSTPSGSSSSPPLALRAAPFVHVVARFSVGGAGGLGSDHRREPSGPRPPVAPGVEDRPVTAPILELIAPGAAPRRHELTRVLTTVGSAPQADLRLVGVPREWLVVQRDRERIAIRELATGARHELGELPLIIDGVSLALVGDEPALAIGPLAMALAQADDPASALAGLVDQAVSAAGADLGAVVLRDGDGHVVAVARDGRGAGLADGAAILSDTVLAEVPGPRPRGGGRRRRRRSAPGHGAERRQPGAPFGDRDPDDAGRARRRRALPGGRAVQLAPCRRAWPRIWRSRPAWRCRSWRSSGARVRRPSSSARRRRWRRSSA
jgi:serine/threonine protein kinase